MHCHIHCNLFLSNKCIVTSTVIFYYPKNALSHPLQSFLIQQMHGHIQWNLNFSNKCHIHCNFSLSNKCIVTSTVIFPYPTNALSHTMQSFLIQQMHCHKQCNLNFSNKHHIHCNLSLSNKCTVTYNAIFPYPTNPVSYPV